MSLIKKRKKIDLRKRRQLRIRNNIIGTPEQPRLNVYFSLKYIYAQVIDDSTGNVLASANSSSKDFSIKGSRSNIEAAKEVGVRIAAAAAAANITNVVFDRAGYKYHGRVKALAEAAREAGLKF